MTCKTFSVRQRGTQRCRQFLARLRALQERLLPGRPVSCPRDVLVVTPAYRGLPFVIVRTQHNRALLQGNAKHE